MVAVFGVKMWIPTKSPKLAVAVYNWKGDVRSGLPLEIGETVQILEENGVWYRGFSSKNRSSWGIFPSCVVTIRPCIVKGSGATAIAELKDDPLVREIACVLREWARLWKKLYVERETYRFSAVAKVMRELLSGRRALLAGTLTQDQTRALRLKLVAKLDWGNRKLVLELVPRRGAEAVDPEDMSLVELYRVHVESAERAAAWRGTLRRAGGSGSSFNSGTLTSNSSNITTTTTVQSHHLMCSMRDFGHTAGGDEAELLLWLHDARRGQPLSERFRIRIARDGFSNYVDRLHANSTLFADLSTTDLTRELWLVAWVIRVGRWAGAGSSGSGTGERRGPVARRPLGAGVLPLAEFLRQPGQHPGEKEYTFKVYQCEEKDFHQLHDMLIRKQTNKCNILPGQPNYGIVVALRLLANAGSISEAVSSGATVTAKRGFPDVIMPGDVRNDLYLTLEKAEFERGGKSTAKNVLATVTVHDSTGQVINECVWGASGTGATSYESVVLYHNNSPAWGEHLRLTVPLETFTNAHVRIEFRHCSTRDKTERKLYGFAFARLMEASGATLRDGAHELYVYKCDDPTKLTSASYLSLPSCAADTTRAGSVNGVVPTFQRSSKENCSISTLLCSTKLTQNEDLLALLQWRARPEKVQETLLRVLRLGDGLSCEELIKFLRDVLDALFALFSTEDGNSTPHSGTVFLVLISICSLLDESRFQHFRPVLDVYIEEHFSAALVYKGLLSSVQHCAEWAASAEGQEPIRKCLRSLGAVFRLAVRSRRLFARATGGQYEDSFRRDVRAALHALKAFAQHPYKEHLAPAQVALMSSWAEVTREVCGALGATEAARAAALVLDAPHQHPPPPPQLARARLHAAQDILKGPLGEDPGKIGLMSSWAEVTREVCGALGATEAARAAALVLDAPHQHPPPPPQLARARLHAAQDILKGPLGEDPGKIGLMSSWAEVTREVCGALGATEAARAAALVLDAPHQHPPPPPQLARARLHAAQDILKGPLGEDPGKIGLMSSWAEVTREVCGALGATEAARAAALVLDAPHQHPPPPPQLARARLHAAQDILKGPLGEDPGKIGLMSSWAEVTREVCGALGATEAARAAALVLDAPHQHPPPPPQLARARLHAAQDILKGPLGEDPGKIGLMSSWAEVTREVCGALGATEAARAAALVLDAPHQHPPPPPQLARARLHAAQDILKGPLGEDPGKIGLMSSWAEVTREVCGALGATEAARAAALVLDAPHQHPPPPPQLARARLHAAQDILKGPLGEDPEARNIILTTACHHLRVHLARRDELSQCAEMIGELVALLWKRYDPDRPIEDDELDPDVDVLCLNTLDVLVETVLHLIGGNSPVLGSMVAGLLGVMELLKPVHYQRLWSHLAPHPHDRKPLKDFLMRAFLVFRHLIEQDVFPADWMVLRVQSCKVLLSALQDLAQPLLERFLGDEPPQFDSQLWSGYMELGVALVTSSALQPERWSGRGPDRPRMRAAAGMRVLATWNMLGPAQLHLVPGAVGALLEITLVSELRRAALGALVALMAAERAHTGEARRTEAALVDKLDSLVADNKADDHYRRLFDTVLMERVSTEGWREAGAAFVACVTRLLERLLDYRAVMQGAEHRDKRMAATVNLLNFYKNEIDRKEMYLRYVYKLHDLHIASDNFVEAGCTLLLYAETLSWESDQIGVDPEHPEMPEWKRKEALYNQVLQYFNRGKCWEKGLPLLRELATLYEVKLCDYPRLSNCLRTHATFLDSVMEQLRPEPEYFRVGFYGKGCPLFVRNKQFVYRGLDYERIGAFTQRLQAEYVAAHILMRNTPPDDSIIANDGQYIQICNVKPVASRRQWPSGTPDQVKRFYACNDVDTFLCDRPLQKPPIDKDNEFKSLWIERTTLVTEVTLPGILRWSEVISRSVEEIPPVEYACETMEATERELRSLISAYTADPTLNINPFSMRLQGTIDANVQGGITKYEQAFMTADFARNATPREAVAAAKLRRLVSSQLAVVDAGLSLHGRLAPEDVKPLHRRLVERFNQLRQNLGPGLARARRQLSESIVNTPLPPVPALDKRSQSIQQSDNYYDDGHLYDKPLSMEDAMEQQSIMSSSLPIGDNRDCVEDNSMIKSAPPLPIRPKSGDPRSPTRPPLEKYRDSIDGELVEQCRHSRASWSEPGDAPPLPPRVSGDKRSWVEAPPAIPRRGPRCADTPDDARDSGVSVDHAYGNADDHAHLHKDLDLTVDSLRYEEIISMMSEPLRVDEGEKPPPIPPKGLGHLSSFDSGHHENGESHC